MSKIINAKVGDIKLYLQKIDRVLPKKKLESDIYDNTIDYIEHSYIIGVVQSLQKETSFYKKMPPSLKEGLAFCMLEDYYQKFTYFFNDFDRHNFAEKIFIRKILTNLDCQIFINDSLV